MRHRLSPLALLPILLLAPAICAAGLAPKTAPPITLEIRRGDSTVGFTIKKWGVMREQGRFRKFSGMIVYDAARPEASRVSFMVDANSVDTGVDARDRTIRSEDFFDVERHPRWTFVSTGVRRAGADTAEITGDITIRGVTHRITVPARFLGMTDNGEEGVLAGFETTFTINRTDFGVLGSRWSGGRALLSNDVTVHLFLGASSPGRR